MNEKNTSRRRFLKTSAGTAALGYAGIADAAPKSDNQHMKIGVVGIDASPRACELIRAINTRALSTETGMRVTTLGVDPTLSSSAKVQETARLNGINSIVDSPEDLIPLVDSVCIFGLSNTDRYAKPLIEAGKPVYIAPPFARSMTDARSLLDLAKRNNVPVISCGPLAAMSEILGAAEQINQSIIQQYYLHGDTGNWIDSMTDMLDMANILVGGTIVRCATHGDIRTNTAVITTLENAPVGDRDPVIGSMLTFREKHNRYWAKIHTDNDVIEEGIYAEPGGKSYNERVWYPFLGAIEYTFHTGTPLMTPESILDSTAALLMAQESARKDGTPVGIEEIGNISLHEHL